MLYGQLLLNYKFERYVKDIAYNFVQKKLLLYDFSCNHCSTSE